MKTAVLKQTKLEVVEKLRKIEVPEEMISALNQLPNSAILNVVWTSPGNQSIYLGVSLNDN